MALMTPLLALVANAGDGTISSFRVDVDSGELDRIAVSEVGTGCSTFAVDPRRELVHAGVKGDPPGVTTLDLDRTTGRLTRRSFRAAPGSPTYLDLSPDGGLLLAAFYHQGLGLSWPVTSDGTLDEPRGHVEYPNAHCIVSAAAGTRAYLVSLGGDLVAHLAVDGDGAFTALEPVLALPPGSGPRHLILDEPAESAYLMTEFTGEAIALAIGPSGALTVCQSVPAFAPDRGLTPGVFGGHPRDDHQVWGADLHLALDRTLLLCSERTESTIAALPVTVIGALGEPMAYSQTETQPRGFAVTADGRHVLVAGELSQTVSLSRIGDDGGLSLLARAETGSGANWIRFVAARE